MKRALILLNFLLVGYLGEVNAQGTACTHLGQNPGSAFPVCGSEDFHQEQVPECGGRTLPSPCNQSVITDLNPYWYKFTCFSSGTLGFLIAPVEESDDYDWQLYDITGHKPEEVYDNADLVIACNWSGREGITGAIAGAASLVECIGNDEEIFSSMPNIVEGHEYLLLISHFTPSQSGYSLSFTGGTAVITDPKAATVQQVSANCKGDEVYLKLSKKMKCSSVEENGSDFSINDGSSPVTSVSPVGCSSGFNTDSVVLQLSSPLPNGTHVLNIKAGDDQNTLLDNCDFQMVASSNNFTVHQDVSADFSYTIKSSCVADTVYFLHDGGHQVNKWNWVFDDGTSAQQNPVMYYPDAGTKNAQLIVSNEHCTDTAAVTFELNTRVEASFTAPEIICAIDPAIFGNSSSGDIRSYRWNFGNGITSGLRDPEPVKYAPTRAEMNYRVTLEVSDSMGCTDTASANVTVAGNCNITVPSAFSPNADGKNDELYPSNAFNADNLIFRVYNRNGQIVFESRDWRRKWDGNVNGQPQSSGVYVWTLNYTLKTTGRPYQAKGTVMLVR